MRSTPTDTQCRTVGEMNSVKLEHDLELYNAIGGDRGTIRINRLLPGDPP